MTDLAAGMPAKIMSTGPRGAITTRDIASGRMAVGDSARAGRPPTTPEPMSFPFGGRGPTFEVDRYDLNPLVSYVRLLGTGSPYGGPAPTMFSSGDLPIFTASGVDPELLRWVAWPLRHSAASTSDQASVYRMAQPDAGLDDRGLQNHDGAAAFESYKAAVWRWATAPAPQPPNPAGKSVGLDDDRDVFDWLFRHP
jgi:hypothetical protein